MVGILLYWGHCDLFNNNDNNIFSKSPIDWVW